MSRRDRPRTPQQPPTPIQVSEAADGDARNYVIALEERLASLEMALDTMDWRMLTHQAEQEFSREGLRTIADLARVMYLKNPLIQRTVELKVFYVWGQGISVKAAADEVQAVVDAFNEHEDNIAELTGAQAQQLKEVDLQVDGNLFLVLFTNAVTGNVRVRSIPFREVLDIVRDPNDAKRPQYYLRTWTESALQPDGSLRQTPRRAYYPDWRYKPAARPAEIGDAPVMWESPVYHVRAGGFSDWAFGVSEVYDQLDWAKAYKEFLEDWASIVRAYRRFAFTLTTPGGARGVSAARSRLQTTLGTGGTGMETNPPAVAGSTFVASEGVNLQPVRTSGATVGAEDGRRLLLMVAAGGGFPETFYGDASVGSLATAKSLDRPTELMLLNRQQQWAGVRRDIYRYVQLWAVKAPRGALRGLGTVITEIEDGRVYESIVWNDDDFDAAVTVDFPPLLEHDQRESVGAIVSAATLDGKALAGTLDLETTVRLLLTALGEPDVEGAMARMFPDGAPTLQEMEDDAAAAAADAQPAPVIVDAEQPETTPAVERMMVDAVRDLRAELTVLTALREGQTDGIDL